MPADTFEKTTWGWQIFQFQQQVGEWVEYQFSQFQRNLPELPDGWSISPEIMDLLKILFWLILGLFLVRVAWQLWQEFSPYVYARLAVGYKLTTSQKPSSSTKSLISSLLSQARDNANQDNYREACRYIYLATIEQLHDLAIAPKQPSRTDREYLQLLPPQKISPQPYLIIFTTHEKLCFSTEEILLANYQQCWQAYQQLFPA